MLYDDVDVSVIDSKDIFGVSRTTDVASCSSSLEDHELSNANQSTSRKSGMKWEFSTDSKPSVKQSKRNKSDYDIFSAGCSNTNSDVFGTAGDVKLVEKRFETSIDFRSKKATTFQEKLSVLDERDRYMRESALKENKNMDIIVAGTCPDMCPERERLLREINCSFSSFEAQIVQNEMLVVPEFLVKEYARSSADQDEPLPHELRPEPVLVDTTFHILVNIVPRMEDGSVDAGEWYHFCWDRLRSVRKDIVQQQLCSPSIVTVLEFSARFHICCAERLFGAERRVFDDKINAENLVNCLQMLINMYDDLATLGIRSPNENEFRVYMMLLLLNSGDVPDLLNEKDASACEATRIYFAFKLNLYAQFFKLVKKTSYLNACILQRYFGGVRSHILNVLVNAYSSGSHTARFPTSFARRVLEFDDDEQTIAFVESHGFATNYNSNGISEIRCSKSSFIVPDVLPVCKSSYVVRFKRVPMLQAITATPEFSPEIRLTKVHSSFDEFDVLKKNAWCAQDQRQKVIQLYGNIYEHQREPDSAEEPMITETVETNARPSLSNIFVHEVSHDNPATILMSPFATTKSILTFNFGKIPNQPSTVFRSNELPSFVSNADIGEADHVVPSTSSVVNTPNDGSSVELYDPETDYVRDTDEYNCRAVVLEPAAKNNEAVAVDHHQTNVEVAKTAASHLDNKSPEIMSPVKKFSSPPICVIRKSEEVVDRLSHALSTFESLYYPKQPLVLSASCTNDFSPSSMRLPSRKLNKLVRRRLKCSRAKKYARLWRKKAQLRKHKRDNFVGIVHLSPEEYFRLWGVGGAKCPSVARSVVSEILENEKALRWCHRLLREDNAWRVTFLGDELAETLSRVQSVQSRPIVCCKLLVSLPASRNGGQRAFLANISKLIRTLYCKPDDAPLGTVWSTRIRGMPICVSANVRDGMVDADDVAGVSTVVVFACEKWEKMDQLRARLESICSRTAYPVHIGAVVIGGDSSCAAFSSAVSSLLSGLRKRGLISGCVTTAWERWFDVCKVIANVCQRAPRSPPVHVRTVFAFVERVGGELFAYLECARSANDETRWRTPIPFIRAYNECLRAVARIICMRDLRYFNLSYDFVLALTAGNNRNVKTNFSHAELVTGAIVDFGLVSFTKWPPKSVHKMTALLNEYCRNLDASNTLLANILRLSDARDTNSVEEISARTPWLEIVELWFRYRMQTISEAKYEDLYVIYDEADVKELVVRVAVETGASSL